MKRRDFIGKTLTASALLAARNFPFEALAAGEAIQLTILHTNDTHSRVEPFPADSKFPNMGGVAARASLLKKIRREKKNVLLFDSGDIFQGTPYFNYFRGKLEMELMSMLGYDAATIGNHDFDAGLEGLAKQIAHADFPLLTANYDFSDTVMEGKTKRFHIFQTNGITTGVFGLGIELEGLVPPKLFGKTKYMEPVTAANDTAASLKREHGCDFVVCLSHLGYRYDTPKVSDVTLAQESTDIDLILGGHTHTFFDEPVVVMNKKNHPVVINQVGWGGVVLGKIDVVFDYTKKRKKFFSGTVKVF
ncbi:MAG TPA: metallophosphatase [Chitinophagales bacterium]|nr:metallophosphatase [Chitinophagales bacterium]